MYETILFGGTQLCEPVPFHPTRAGGSMVGIEVLTRNPTLDHDGSQELFATNHCQWQSGTKWSQFPCFHSPMALPHSQALQVHCCHRSSCPGLGGSYLRNGSCGMGNFWADDWYLLDSWTKIYNARSTDPFKHLRLLDIRLSTSHIGFKTFRSNCSCTPTNPTTTVSPEKLWCKPALHIDMWKAWRAHHLFLVRHLRPPRAV